MLQLLLSECAVGGILVCLFDRHSSAVLRGHLGGGGGCGQTTADVVVFRGYLMLPGTYSHVPWTVSEVHVAHLATL